ncbi:MULTISPECIES: thiamine diphosphokinase [Peptoniphilus]|jgi:thiamine diphosphokinase|nr:MULTISPECIES: thiamine diphosphokinase [Peptoniphilus]MBS6610209.1 thiamine diphosphokinase [Peptoniphilus harei]MDU1043299.1 thiamine diphosphokinase [Peptoniphilus rhinitidis]MDU1954016.1 thiamine diphosphokinase [Peptoniphilus lacydonensis]MDU2115254.1 thiamine diphosphokinase [Peptoniphilus lacydonensis]MDU3751529.1 thiamine diphosphokinase [Peptoniphilus rhinitidis]
MKRALLITGGREVSKDLIKKYKKNRFVLVADGGARLLRKYNLKGDLLLGDLDSIGNESLKYVRENNIKFLKFPSQKAATDTELCINYLINEKYEDIVILGALGTRLDHELANLFLLKKLYNKGICAKIIDDNNEVIYVKEGEYKFKKSDKKYFSLINAGESLNFSTKGLFYEVENLKINNYNPGRAVSNEILEDEATIIINSGSAFIIKSID